MPILTEGTHASGFLVWEVLRDYTRETIRLGGVPIRVVMPPRMVPKANGISTCPAVIPSRPDKRYRRLVLCAFLVILNTREMKGIAPCPERPQ